LDDARSKLGRPTPDRLLVAAQALRMGMSVEEICGITKYDPWFVRQIEEIVEAEKELSSSRGIAEAGILCQLDGDPRANNARARMTALKRMGFSDARIAELAGVKSSDVAGWRKKYNIHPVYKRVDTCAAEFDSGTPYMYSSYDGECEAEPSGREKIII